MVAVAESRHIAAVSLLLALLLRSAVVHAGKLLVVPMDGSHWTAMQAVAEELGSRGNTVVVVIPEVSMRLGPSRHCVTRTYPVPYGRDVLDHLQARHTHGLHSTQPFLQRVASRLSAVGNLTRFLQTTCESLLYNQEMMWYLREQQFDAVLTDPVVPTGVIVAEHLSVPVVLMLRGIPCGLDFAATACPSPPSFVPRFFTHNTDRMSFQQRVLNTLVSLLEPLLCSVIYRPFDGVASRFLQRDVTLAEMLSRASLWLMRFDFTFEFPRPLMPNMVLVGGINCAVRNPLPQELQKFVNESGEHGFIVFTLGSVVSQMPVEKAKLFFEAFRQIPQRVLWRYTGPTPDNLPENVKLMKWLPQNDLLGHPKARAFITHGGTHGIYEGICNAVPMVMMPLFGDQGDNVQRMAVRGVAEVLSIFEVTTETLLQALNKVINDTSYKDNMLKLSAVHKDRPMEPLDLAVFWTEFVMRHKGADHLRPAAHHLNWVQYHCLDVIGLLVVIVVTVVMVTVKCCAFCFRKCCMRKSLKKKED
ncbi:UDP-glucuronosyltransferase 1A1-like isoform X1 [Megalops cyprinoides]|uniref:UDP-glucuronosyltransferase 1A1-like isoform X1 n=1 Tax=Megalops cyprinoides TaxID=118141 RepID=UPI00186497E1|nr:UDP-glucuronosyltransferase 1A1-like isoform X1 [Megalops cyprinoides]